MQEKTLPIIPKPETKIYLTKLSTICELKSINLKLKLIENPPAMELDNARAALSGDVNFVRDKERQNDFLQR